MNRFGIECLTMQRAMVVDDYPPLATVVAIGLRRIGFQVDRHTSATRALAASGIFDVAVLDLDLADGDGVTLARRLLADGRAHRIVFFSATRDETLRADAERLGTLVDKAAGLDGLLKVVSDAPDLALAVGAELTPTSSSRKRSGVMPRVPR